MVYLSLKHHWVAAGPSLPNWRNFLYQKRKRKKGSSRAINHTKRKGDETKGEWAGPELRPRPTATNPPWHHRSFLCPAASKKQKQNKSSVSSVAVDDVVTCIPSRKKNTTGGFQPDQHESGTNLSSMMFMLEAGWLASVARVLVLDMNPSRRGKHDVHATPARHVRRWQPTSNSKCTTLFLVHRTFDENWGKSVRIRSYIIRIRMWLL